MYGGGVQVGCVEVDGWVVIAAHRRDTTTTRRNQIHPTSTSAPREGMSSLLVTSPASDTASPDVLNIAMAPLERGVRLQVLDCGTLTRCPYPMLKTLHSPTATLMTDSANSVGARTRSRQYCRRVLGPGLVAGYTSGPLAVVHLHPSRSPFS